MDEKGLYNEKVMDHFEHPRNVGKIEDADAIGTVGNAACGDIMKLYLKIKGDTVVNATFKTFGCGAAVATSSMVTELIKGKTIEEVKKVTNKAVTEALGGLPKNKIHCSVLAEEAVEAALKNYSEKRTDTKQPV